MIIVDSREQLPLWSPSQYNVQIKKLDEGDYTTSDLLGHAHIERKSPSDLYGSLVQDHLRFRKELIRAREKDVTLCIFVECPEEDFLNRRFKNGYRLSLPKQQLKKMIKTISKKYQVEFVWCSDREEMKEKMVLWFLDQKSRLNRKFQSNLVNFIKPGNNLGEENKHGKVATNCEK